MLLSRANIENRSLFEMSYYLKVGKMIYGESNEAPFFMYLGEKIHAVTQRHIKHDQTR